MIDFCFGFSTGLVVLWVYFRWCRLLRTRREWYADPVVYRKHGDDPNPNGWSYYRGYDR